MNKLLKLSRIIIKRKSRGFKNFNINFQKRKFNTDLILEITLEKESLHKKGLNKEKERIDNGYYFNDTRLID